MSTNPTTKAPEKPEEAAPAIVDEQTGVYGWFRRNQKKLLYSVGLFVLVTFSVSGPMLAWVRDAFEASRDMPTIVVNGERIKLKSEDYDIGQQIANSIDRLGMPYRRDPDVSCSRRDGRGARDRKRGREVQSRQRNDSG